MFSYNTRVESVPDEEALKVRLKEIEQEGWEVQGATPLSTRKVNDQTTYRIRLRTRGIPVDRLGVYGR